MVNALNVLNSEKKTLKADCRAAYIAHEQTEDNKRGEKSKLNKELQLVEDKNTEKRVAIKGVNDEILFLRQKSLVKLGLETVLLKQHCVVFV